MNGENLFAALSQIDDRFVQEAAKPMRGKKIVLYRIMPLAACCAIILLCYYRFRPMTKLQDAQMESFAVTEEAAPEEPEYVEKAAATGDAIAKNGAAPDLTPMLGPFYLGMSGEEVQNVLGEPMAQSALSGENDCERWGYEDISFKMNADMEVISITVSQSSPYCLENGIGIGSVEEEFLQKYSDVICIDTNSEQTYYVVQLEQTTLSFALEDGVICEMTLEKQ